MKDIKKKQSVQVPPTPDYRNLGTTRKMVFTEKPYTPTAKDSAEYKMGFNNRITGGKKIFPSMNSVLGYNEAKERGLNKKK